MHYANHTDIHIHKNYLSVTKAGFRISCIVTGSQCKHTTNARIEPSSILEFGRTFTLTYGRNARYSEPGLTLINIKITSLKHINGSMNTIAFFTISRVKTNTDYSNNKYYRVNKFTLEESLNTKFSGVSLQPIITCMQC